MRIYVGNLSYKVDEDGLREAFEAHGAVESAQVIMDRYTGRSRGFGFVEMSNDDEAKEVNRVRERRDDPRNSGFWPGGVLKAASIFKKSPEVGSYASHNKAN